MINNISIFLGSSKHFSDQERYINACVIKIFRCIYGKRLADACSVNIFTVIITRIEVSMHFKIK